MASELRNSFLFLFTLFVLGPCSLKRSDHLWESHGDVGELESHTGIPGATIIVRNLGTGVEATDTTNTSGFWRIPALPPDSTQRARRPKDSPRKWRVRSSLMLPSSASLSFH